MQDNNGASSEPGGRESSDAEDDECDALTRCAAQSLTLRTSCEPHHASIARVFSDVVVDSHRDEGLYPYQSHVRQLLLEAANVNILIASPTGSGKSFAIYEAALRAQRNHARLYVGEPLIALVEQVYNALLKRGVAAAMRTGPSSKGEDEGAVAVVATYEVLARMGADKGFADASSLVLDEVHFLSTERGPVLQEIFRTCRESCTPLIALSGTLPNAEDLGRFMSLTNGLPTKILGASKRPVELQFYYYDSDTRRFSVLRGTTRDGKAPYFDDKSMGGLHDKQAMLAFVRQLGEWHCYPALLVAFSCRLLNDFAQFCSCLDLLDRSHKSVVTRSFDKMLLEIPEEDRCNFDWLRPLLVRGVALHHGHLPVQYLELVCALASKRCVQLVFSSSTLSAGIDLPVRTVCLLNTRIPRKVGGEVKFESIDPLLCKQLCGRAGRPGLEPIGNVVFVGHGSTGYDSAVALRNMPLPPILPFSEFCDGDVLRAVRQHRSIVLDRLVFEDPSTQKIALVAEKSAQLATDAGALAPHLRSSTYALAWQIQKLRQATPALFPYCIVEGEEDMFVVDRGRNVEVTTYATEEAGAIQFMAKGKFKRPAIPFMSLTEVLDMRKIFEDLAASPLLRRSVHKRAGKPRAAEQLLCIYLNMLTDQHLLSKVPSSFEYKIIASRLEREGYLSEGCITLKGRAACELRTCSSPQVVVEALTRYSFLAPAYMAFASLVLGSGKEDSTYTGVLETNFESETRSSITVSASSFTSATLAWAAGGVLFELCSTFDISVGEFVRHVIRVHDTLVEMESAYNILGIDVPSLLVDAGRSIRRGLPFLRRGAGRVEVD